MAWSARCVRLVTFIAVILAGSGTAHGGTPLLRRTLDGWTRQEGLPLNTVRHVHRARDGYLWLGTDVGLVRFDGVRFTVFDAATVPGFPADFVNGIHEDREGALWVALDGGLVRMKDGAFTSIPLDGLASRNVSDVREDAAGNVWFITSADLGTVRDGRIAHLVQEPARARGGVHLETTPDGDVWATGDGLIRVHRGQATVALIGNDLPHVPTCVTQDGRGTLWVGMVDGSLGPVRDRRFVPARPPGLPPGRINDMHFDADGGLWISVLGAGLHRFADGVLESLTTREGLRSDDVEHVLSDAEGNVWIGTAGGGLHRLREAPVTVLSRREGLSHANVLSVFEDAAGALWVGTSGGDLNRITAGRAEFFGPAQGLAPRAVLSMTEHGGRLWAGTGGGGTWCFDGRRFAPCGEDSGAVVMALLPARDGTLWLGSEHGLRRLLGTRFVDVWPRGPQAVRNPTFVIALAETPDGTIWAGTRSDGLLRVDPRSPGPDVRDAGLGKLTVLALRADADGTLWVGTADHGLLRARAGTFKAFRKKDGLPDDSVYSIQDDGHGRLWMSGSAGIFRVERAALEAFADGRATSIAAASCGTYGIPDGLRAGECTGGGQAGWTLRDGRLAFATPDGAALIDPAHLPGTTSPPPVTVEALTCDGRRIGRPVPDASGVPAASGVPTASGVPAATGKAASGPEAIVVAAPFPVVPGGARSCEIAYTGLQLAAAAAQSFRYRLRGFDDAWQDAGPRRSAFFTGLAPGDYTFEVVAQNRENVRSVTPAVLRFRVAPRFYQTAWFRALALLALVGAGFGAYRVRVRTLLRRELLRLEREVELERVRTRIASDLHDDIGATLSRMAILLDAVQRRLSPDQDDLRAPLDRIAESAREAVDSMSDIVWAVNPRRDRLGDLALRMRRFASDALDARSIAFAFESPREDDLRLGPDLRRDVLLLFKESVTNAWRHARCTRVDSALAIAGDRLELRVTDDGRGFDPAAAREGNGLTSMQRRIAQHGGTMHVETAPGRGTSLRFELPLSPGASGAPRAAGGRPVAPPGA